MHVLCVGSGNGTTSNMIVHISDTECSMQLTEARKLPEDPMLNRGEPTVDRGELLPRLEFISAEVCVGYLHREWACERLKAGRGEMDCCIEARAHARQVIDGT